MKLTTHDLFRATIKKYDLKPGDIADRVMRDNGRSLEWATDAVQRLLDGGGTTIAVGVAIIDMVHRRGALAQLEETGSKTHDPDDLRLMFPTSS
jgi:hypothetical protein